MDPLTIVRVANGWIVRPSPYCHQFDGVDTTGTWHVFNHIEDLCETLPWLCGIAQSADKQQCLNEADLLNGHLTDYVNQKGWVGFVKKETDNGNL